jgi:hypothetical protein
MNATRNAQKESPGLTTGAFFYSLCIGGYRARRQAAAFFLSLKSNHFVMAITSAKGRV